MIKYVVKLCLLLILISVTSSAQQNFEGTVNVRVTNSRGESNELKLMVKGNALRLQSEAGDDVKNGNFIVKNDSIFILMPNEKKYIQMPINVNNKVQNYSNKADNLKKTGETKEILGYEAEKWIYNDDNGSVVEIWSTKQLGNIVNLTNFIPAAANEVWYKNIFSEGFFPLSITITNSGNKVVNKIEVTDINKNELEDSDFELPEGFQQMQTSHQAH